MPLPEDEADWQNLDIMFATRSGGVRRNSLADFVEINKNGKIAMKLDEGDSIVGVETCSASDDVLLTTSLGQAIRFQVDDVRVFKGRDSTGVRGISLAEGDKVISMSIINHFDATSDERAAYLKMSRAVRGESARAKRRRIGRGSRMTSTRRTQPGALRRDERGRAVHPDHLAKTATASAPSSHEYRITGRGGKGIVAMAVNKRNGKLVGCVPGRGRATRSCWSPMAARLIRVPVERRQAIRIVAARRRA